MADEQNTSSSSSIPSEEISGIVGYIESKYDTAKSSRQTHESRWLRAYKNYRGVYDSSTQFRDSEKSKVFVKITLTKTLAAYGQIVDILFANKKFPITVEATPVSEGVANLMHAPMPGEEQLQTSYGYEGDGNELLPGATEVTPMEKLGGLKKQIKDTDKSIKSKQKQSKVLKKTLQNKKKALKEIEREKYKKKNVSVKEASDFLKKYAKKGKK